MILAGIFLGIDLALWNISFQYTTVANSNLLANLTPFVVIPFSYFVFKEKINKLFITGFLVVLTGVILLLMPKLQIKPEQLTGDVLAFLTAFFYAGFMLCVYRLRKDIKSNTIMFVSAFGSLFILGCLIPFFEELQIPKTLNDLMPLLGLSIISQILGQGLLAFAMKQVPAKLTSIITLSQPVIASIYAFFIFQEHLTVIEIIAIFITLFGIYLAKKGN